MTPQVLLECSFAIEIEPPLASGSRPEFLIRHGEYAAYVEVTTDLGNAHENREQHAIRDLIAQASPRIRNTGFGIWINEITVGHGNPSPRRFADFLDRWFATFDYREQRTRMEHTPNAMPERVYAERNSGWEVKMILWALPSADQRLESIAGTTGVRSGWSTSRKRLHDNIDEKVRQHKKCEHPLVLAIACNDLMTEPDTEDVTDALIGKSYATFSLGLKAEPIWHRKHDGRWALTNPQTNKQPAGIILMRRVYPWTLKNVRPELWDNPNAPAKHRLRPWLFKHCAWEVPGSGQFVQSSGERAGILAVT
jgi:hypothetical protein